MAVGQERSQGDSGGNCRYSLVPGGLAGQRMTNNAKNENSEENVLTTKELVSTFNSGTEKKCKMFWGCLVFFFPFASQKQPVIK